MWVREVEALLGNEDIGRDLQGVRFLLKMHQVYCTVPPYVCVEEEGERERGGGVAKEGGREREIERDVRVRMC